MSNFTKLKLCHTLGISQSTHIWVKGALTALLLVLCGNVAKAQTDLTFKEGIRYSQWVIESRLGDFYGNRKKFGFTTYDRNLNTKNTVSTWYKEDGKTYGIQVDYVAGLVAKATIEAADYYKNFDWSKPWFKSVEWYGNKCEVSTSPDNLDAINASKMYFGIYNLATGTFKGDAESSTASNATKQLGNALTALSNYNKNYAFAAGTTLNGKDIAGGWYHKSTYPKQMWLDGQYMGPATLAQLIKGYSSYSSNKLTDNDWNLITKQFTIVWEQCWDSEEKLLNHAFSSEKLSYWTSDPDIWDTAQADKTKWTSMTAAGHSAAFWGRAEGWYFLALVDVLEQMVIAGQEKTDNYSTLLNYLITLADGIRARQDNTTGCWYQLIAKNGSYSASYYRGKTYSAKSNYLESSCTALFTAAYLKAIRLGFLAKDTYFSVAENAYKGMIEQFMKQRTDGTVDLLGCCKSAGLGTSTDFNDDKFRDGSNAYYLLGADVTPTSTNSGDDYTEGKVLGAFILAATEYERQYQPSMLLSKDLNKSYTLSSNEPLTVEVLGDGTAKYQWYNANTSTAIDGATNASYIPTESGKYYCVITVTPTSASAKTRTASTSGSYTITTSTADVTVPAAATTYTVTFNAGSYGTCSTPYLTQKSEGASITLPSVTANTGYTFDGWYTAAEGGAKVTSPYTPSSSVTLYAHYSAAGGSGTEDVVIATFEKATATTWNATEKNGFSISGVSIKKGTTYVKMEKSTTLTMTIPSGYTVTGLNINALCTSDSENSELKYNNGETNLGTVTIKSGKTLGDYNCTFSNNVTGQATITITRGNKEVNINTIKVLGYSGTPSTPTTHTVTATAENGNGNVTITDSNGTTITSGSQVKHGTSLTFTATANEGYEFSGWTVTGTTGTADGATYTIASLEAETAVTATFTETSSGGGGTATYYSYKVEKAGLTAPGINTSKYITDSKGKKLVKMTFGGWKWNQGNYSIDRTKTNEEPKVCADSWKNSTSEQNVASIDDHLYWFEGTQDAVDESKAVSENEIYGRKRYGWFVSPTRDASGKTTESHPFTLPVRGSFMTFEPTQNGTLSIYILQNGAWNTDKSGTYTDTETGETIKYNKGDIAAGEFRPHAFHVVNQRGLTVQEFSPKYSVETRQTVTTQDYYCMFTTDKDYSEAKYKDPHNVARWTEFKDYMSPAEQRRCHDNWKNVETGAQTITELDNGSFLAIQKGIVKYTFHVTKNETYYFFSNFSKMGFSGARFTPDESQPTATPAEGQISTLELSDVTAYNEITATPTGSNIEGTNLNDYTYSINGTEIAPVAGVTIPQFHSIKLTRTFKAGQWTTLTLPFNLTEEEVQRIFGDGTQIIMLDKATLSSDGGARLHFIYHEIQNVLPGYPYLIKPTLTDITNDANVSVIKADNTITDFTVYGKCINPFIKQFEVNTTPYTFKGTPGYCTADAIKDGITTNYSVKYKANDIFVSEGDGKLYVSGDSSYGKGYRAWLQKKETGNPTAVKSISVVMSSFSDDDDTTTSIDVAEMAPDLIEALGIQTGVYNLSGQRVANDTRNLKAGIYIVNGKKTVVR